MRLPKFRRSHQTPGLAPPGEERAAAFSATPLKPRAPAAGGDGGNAGRDRDVEACRDRNKRTKSLLPPTGAISPRYLSHVMWSHRRLVTDWAVSAVARQPASGKPRPPALLLAGASPPSNLIGCWASRPFIIRYEYANKREELLIAVDWQVDIDIDQHKGRGLLILINRLIFM